MKKILDSIVQFVLSLNETKRTILCSKIGRRCSYLVIAPRFVERRVKA